VWFNLIERLASISNFTGNWTEKGNGDFWVSDESGTASRIWYATVTTGTKSYNVIVFQEEMPDSAVYQNVHQAKLSLSGITLTIGFKIGLF